MPDCNSRSTDAIGPCHRSRPSPCANRNPGVRRCQNGHQENRHCQDRESRFVVQPSRHQPCRAERAVSSEEVCPPHHPRPPVRTGKDVVEALRSVEIEDQDDGGERNERDRDDRRGERDERTGEAQEVDQCRDQHGAGADRLEQEIEDHVPSPGLAVRDVVIHSRITGRFRIRHGRAEGPKVDLPFLVIQRTHRSLRPDHAFLGAEVEDLRARAFFRLPDHEGFALEDPRHLRRRIVEIPEDAALRRTDDHARRLQLVLHAVRAEIAFLGRVGVGIDEQLIVRAGFHAGAAADTRLLVEIDNAVAAAVERVGRADANAGSVFALVAQHGEEKAARIRKQSLLDRLHPAAIHADGNLVLDLAGDRACVASDALPQVYGESVVGHRRAIAYQQTVAAPARGPLDR